LTASSLMIRNGALPASSVLKIFDVTVQSCRKPVRHEDDQSPANPNVLDLNLRWRPRATGSAAECLPVETRIRWPIAETAMLVVDMWDDMWHKKSADRTRALAVRLE